MAQKKNDRSKNRGPGAKQNQDLGLKSQSLGPKHNKALGANKKTLAPGPNKQTTALGVEKKHATVNLNMGRPGNLNCIFLC